MSKLRIVSLLPSATEMLSGLGLADNIVGISHECDYPPAIRDRPAVVKPILALEQLSQAEIDQAVSRQLQEGQSLYQIDAGLLAQLAPDLIVTQDLCQVCAPSGAQLGVALSKLHKQPRLLSLSPKSLENVLGNILEMGEATDRKAQADALIAHLKARLRAVADKSAKAAARPRVFCLEWIDPLYCSGHWVPEMVELAGGIDSLSRRTHSVSITWQELQRWDPEVLVIMPCGYSVPKVLELVPQLYELPGWKALTAVKAQRLYAVDANAYFARPGPRLVDGTELLAHLIHPELFEWKGPAEAYARVC